MRSFVMGCAIVIGVLLPLPTSAQGVVDMSSSMGDEAAKQHFKVGNALYQSGRFAEAAAEWEKAYALSKKPQLQYNLYVAYRDASDLPNAIGALRRYLELAEIEPESRVNLQARLRSMEEANSRAPAATPASTPTPAPATAEPAALPAPAVVPVVAPPPAPSDRADSGGASTAGYVLAIGGGALLAGGVITGILASGKIASIEDDCEGGTCPSGYGIDDERSSANTLRTLSVVLASTGLVAGVVGTVLLLSADGSSEQAAIAHGIASHAGLGCSPDACVASVRGAF